MKRIAIAQMGGPTPVFNATLAGIVSEAKSQFPNIEILGIQYGMDGLSKGNYVLILNELANELKLPGAYLGAGRAPATEERIDASIDFLVRKGVDALFLIGGNGTMWTANAFNKRVKERNVSIQVIGVPKTVDNDLNLTDHSPGYASAAKFVALATQDIALDLRAMKDFEQVRILEIMGKNVGWLPAASALYKGTDTEAPHMVLLPEQPIDIHRVVSKVKSIQDKLGYVLIVMGEGVHSTCGSLKNGIDLGLGGPIIPGGVGEQLAMILRKETGLISRAERLGLLQRCFRLAVSENDRKEAWEQGTYAVQCARYGKSGVMVSLSRKDNKEYTINLTTTPLEEIGGRERVLSLEDYDPEEFTIKDRFLDWLRPII